MTTSVVTGGAGFLGSHLCDRLLAEGHRVIAVDNLITGNPDNISHLEGRSDFRFVQHDVTVHLDLGEPVDNVLHFASPASPIDYLELPIQTLKVGSLGTHNMLGLAMAAGARFLLASTSEVYGDPLVHPQPESYWGNVNPVGPRGVYDEAKRFAEAMVMAYHRVHGVETRIVRIFNTYGPRMRPRDGRVVPAFIQQALAGEPLTVFGDGSQTRSFCYVEDLVEGIWCLLQSDAPNPVNIGNPTEMSILEFAHRIIAFVDSGSTIDYRELPVDDPKTRQPDITQARDVLGWEPQVSFDEGLARTVEFFRAKAGPIARSLVPNGRLTRRRINSWMLSESTSRTLSRPYPEKVEIATVDQLMLESARQNAKRPAYVKLAVPDDMVKQLRGQREQRDLVLLLRVPRDIVERADSPIILPNEAPTVRRMR